MSAAGAVLVTGASSGIGASIAEELARAGYLVGCLSRRGTAPDVDGCVSFTADVTDEEAVGQAVRDLAGRRPLAGLVNCAGRHIEGPSVETSADDLRALLDTNFVSAFRTSCLVQPLLVEQGGGLIVNIGSFYDRLGVPGNLAYAASKAALGSMTRTLAVEWARDGIRVLDVAPGYVETELNAEFFEDVGARSKIERRIPLRRVGRVAEVGRLVASLFTLEIGFLTGSTIYVDGAHSITV